MKPGAFILPLAVFALSLGATMAVRKPGQTASHEPTKEHENPTAPTKRHREQSAFDQIKAALRQGDPAGARGILKQLAERDPVAFFELLESLPGIPGMDELVAEAAARLPWNQPEITGVLNRIGPDSWRDVAWESYGAAQIGIRPDEEILKVVDDANTRLHLAGVRTLMLDAAEKRPEAFMALLNREGGTGTREEFFEMVVKHHPEMADALFNSIPNANPGANYDRGYVLQARARCLPTADNLMATLALTGSRGAYSGTYSCLFTHQAYDHANPAEKEKIIEAIASQPALARNTMLTGALLYGDKLVPLAEFSRLTSLYTSFTLQSIALDRWIEQQPELATADRSWIEQLPTEKMRARARELLESKQVEPAKGH